MDRQAAYMMFTAGMLHPFCPNCQSQVLQNVKNVMYGNNFRRRLFRGYICNSCDEKFVASILER